jgi:acetylornithine deacetylase/succinyl-diaminopimelate desuccinylase-like protein
MDLLPYIESRREEHLNDLKEFLRIPSVSTKTEHKADIERAAQWLSRQLKPAGMEKVEIVPTKMHPLVYGESPQRPDRPTVLFYGHYDVQPAEPLDLWTSPAFEPEVRNGNLYGRGTADDKGQVHIHMKALEALQKTQGELPINVKVMIEGEEEVGSANLWDFVQKNREPAESRRAGRFRYQHAGTRRALHHLRPARLGLLSGGNHRGQAGFAFGRVWRRGAESDHHPGRDDRQAS